MKKLLLLMVLGIFVFACKDNSDAEGVKLVLSESAMALNVEATTKLSVTSPAQWVSSEIVWTSLNSSVARVDSEGVVTGISPGVTTIHALVKNSSAVMGVCTVTVGNVIVTQIEAILVKKGGDHTLVADVRSEIMSKYDTLDLVYIITPANSFNQKTTFVRSDSVGSAVVEVLEAVADKSVRGLWRARVTGTGVIDNVNLSVKESSSKVVSNVLEIEVTPNVDYTPTKGKTDYQTASLVTLYANHVDTLVIAGLPADGVFAPFIWRTDYAEISATPFSYKNKAKETVWGAKVMGALATSTTTNIYASNADGHELVWSITTAADTSTNKEREVLFNVDSLSMSINSTKQVADFDITYELDVAADYELELSFIPRPAKNTAGVNEKWWLLDGQVAIPVGQVPATVDIESDNDLVEVLSGIQGQGEALAIVTLTDNDGETASDTMLFNVADFAMQNPITGANVTEVYATYKTADFGTKVEPIAKLFNYTYGTPIELKEATLFIKKGTEVAPGDILKKDESVETITAINKSASTGAGVEQLFSVVTPDYASEVKGYAVKFTFTLGGFTYTAVRDAAPDKGVPYAAPAR